MWLVPDDLFGVDYGGGYRFFAVEIDRRTESIEPRSCGRNTFARKLAACFEVIYHRTYRDVRGTPNLMVIIVTTSMTRMPHMMAYLAKRDHGLVERFLFRALSMLGSHWRVPPVLSDILKRWPRADGSLFDIAKA